MAAHVYFNRSRPIIVLTNKCAVIKTTFEQARSSLDAMCDAAARGETVIIRRPGRAPVALIHADEVRSLEELRHLFSSPANTRRLLRGILRTLDAAGGRNAGDSDGGK